MGIDHGRIAGIDARDPSTFLGLMKDDVDGTDQRVSEMERRNVFGEAVQLLKMSDDWEESFEEGLYVAVDEPAHTRAPALAFVVHQADELGMLGDIEDMGADAGANR
jgi:hypothetical protein